MADDPIHEKTTAGADTDPELLKHVESLGLKTVAEYIDWCSRHGFSRRTKKNWKDRLKERAFVTRAVADARIAQNKMEVRKPERVIERIFRGELGEDDVSQPYLKAVCRAFKAAQASPQTEQTFLRLLLHFHKHADLRDMKHLVPNNGRQDGNTLIWGLLALARHAREWLRPLEDWKPESHNTRRQFSALARHLFAEWPVPPFMDAVWFKGAAEEAIRQQFWFLLLGVGFNIRTADLPLLYTKRMSYFFMQAPPDFAVEAALRWGQILGMGGDPRLARAIIGTRLGTHFEQEDFWTEVLRFFVANPMLDLAHAGPIIDFLQHQKYEPQVVAVAPGVIERRAPPQPNFSVKGRSPASLLKLVGSWRQGLRQARQPYAEWRRSGIEWFQYIEESGGNVRIWTISELLDSKVLVAEGREMQHCVASYVSSCLRGGSSIWALESETNGARRKVMTVEVIPATRVICQARGKRNVLPGEKHREILRRWAVQAGLQLAAHV
jgi:PcfJ-like protein